LETKKLGLLREIVPQVKTIVALVNLSTPVVKREMAELQDAATKFGQRIKIASASTEPELESAFAGISELHAGGLVVAPDPFFNAMRERFVPLGGRYAIPGV